MIFTAPTPTTRVRVRNRFLGLNNDESTEAYLIAVTSSPNRPLLFTVHLESGALWSRLPINSLWCGRFGQKIISPQIPLEIAQPYSCLEGDIQVVEHKHLKNMDVIVKISTEQQYGSYLFTIDVNGCGLSEDPVQFKTHNIIVLENGNLVAYPNNFLLFVDSFFTEENGWPLYRRQDEYYLAGG